jgi:hypothetical protein
MFGKNAFSGFLGKGMNEKILGAGKGLVRILDDPMVHSFVTSLSPTAGAAIGLAKKSGLLEKLKN